MISNKKIRVAILMGGISNERAVSLSTGKTAAEYLDPAKFSFRTYDTKKDLPKLFYDVTRKKIDVCFIALHGRGGEDGSIQGMLELLKVPYTGPGIMASAIGMNKIVSKKLFQKEKILTPKFIFFDEENIKRNPNDVFKKIKKEIGLPCVVKPATSGSSVGVSIVKKENEIKKGIESALREDNRIIVEKYIKGKEITVGILGNKEPRVLPVIEIVPKKNFFDYQAKYNPKFSDEIVPARIPAKITKKAQRIAGKVYQLIECRGFSRVDMILQGEKIYVLEINTIPGLTPNSLLPKAARAAGISFSKLLEKIIKFALEYETVHS